MKQIHHICGQRGHKEDSVKPKPWRFLLGNKPSWGLVSYVCTCVRDTRTQRNDLDEQHCLSAAVPPLEMKKLITLFLHLLCGYCGFRFGPLCSFCAAADHLLACLDNELSLGRDSWHISADKPMLPSALFMEVIVCSQSGLPWLHCNDSHHVWSQSSCESHM